MTTSYNRYTGFSNVGNYKDIVDDLFYVNMNDTPIMDSANSIEASDYVHYWEEVAFTAPSSNAYKRNENGSLSTTYTPPTKTERSNTVVESAVPFDVSMRVKAIAQRKGAAGVRDAWAKAKADADVVLKDNVEWSLLNGTQASGDSVSVASECNGLTVIAAAYGTDAYNTNVSGGETAFLTGLDTNRAAGGLMGRKKTLLTSYTNKRLIAQNWAGRATAVNNLDEKQKIYADVEIYVSQYGPIAILGHNMAASSGMTLYDAVEVATAWLYPTQTVELGTTNLVAGMAARANCLTLQVDRPSTTMFMVIS